MISKLADMRRGEDKCRTSKIHWKIGEPRTRIISTIDTQIKKNKQSKHDTKESHQTTREDKRKEVEKKAQSNNSKQLTKWQ